MFISRANSALGLRFFSKLWVAEDDTAGLGAIMRGSLNKIHIMNMKACKEKVKPQMGLAARKFGRRWGERSAAQISHHKVPA